jgi:hypothetical protein
MTGSIAAAFTGRLAEIEHQAGVRLRMATSKPRRSWMLNITFQSP